MSKPCPLFVTTNMFIFTYNISYHMLLYLKIQFLISLHTQLFCVLLELGCQFRLQNQKLRKFQTTCSTAFEVVLIINHNTNIVSECIYCLYANQYKSQQRDFISCISTRDHKINHDNGTLPLVSVQGITK